VQSVVARHVAPAAVRLSAVRRDRGVRHHRDAVLQFGLISEGLCAGDCDGDHEVRINELVSIVSLALADGTSDGCPLE
jgi:hypothetical protein